MSRCGRGGGRGAGGGVGGESCWGAKGRGWKMSFFCMLDGVSEVLEFLDAAG